MGGHSRFVVLDGLRGIAALSVVAIHISLPLHFPNIATHAYLAVDFFFLLSGLVIDRAYSDRLNVSDFRQTFLLQRFIRLFPLIVAGVLLGALVSGAKMLAVKDFDFPALGCAVALGLVLLPFARLPHSGFAFPLNGPLWSLFYEGIVNIVFSFASPFLKKRLLVTIMVLAAAALVWTAFDHGGLEIGSGKGVRNFVGGGARVGFSFFAGVLISRHYLVLVRFAIPTWLAPLVLLTALMVPQISFTPLYDLGCVFLVFPAIIALGACTQAAGWVQRSYSFLGALSYPLYAIHYPVMRIFQFAQEKYHLQGAQLALSIGAEFSCCVMAGIVAMKYYDEPIRRWLRKLQRKSEPIDKIFIGITPA